MSATKTAWHPPFTGLLQERSPRWVRVTAEVQLSAEPLRVDDLLEVWSEEARDLSDRGGTLQGLWPQVHRVALLEYKSVARAFRHGDLFRLFAYGALWLATHQGEAAGEAALKPEDLTLVLAVPTINKALRDELRDAGISLERRDDGYHRVSCGPTVLIVAELRVIAEREDDDLLRWFAFGRIHTLAAHQWVRQHLGSRSDRMSTHTTPELEGYDEYLATFLQELTPEQRLAGLAPEQRLAGLAPEETLLALPDSVLRALPESFVEGLSAPVREAIRARRAR
ncbi:MAG: hypothetical protein R3A48_23665 [Polyangiales bacterium]